MVLRLLLWVVVTGLAAWWLPWWVAVLVGLAGLNLAFRPWRASAGEGVARSRGFVLRHAEVKLDRASVEPIDPTTRRCQLDLTVRPRPGNSRVRPWLPREFRFLPDVGHEVRAGSIEHRQGGSWTPVTDAPLIGEQRLRLRLVVPDGVRRISVRYFLEELAELDLGTTVESEGGGV